MIELSSTKSEFFNFVHFDIHQYSIFINLHIPDTRKGPRVRLIACLEEIQRREIFAESKRNEIGVRRKILRNDLQNYSLSSAAVNAGHNSEQQVSGNSRYARCRRIKMRVS